MPDGKLKWCYVENPPGGRPKPRWYRSAALAEDGTVYAPAVIGGDTESIATLRAAWGGNVSMVLNDGHAFMPTWWLAREYPHMADICTLIESGTQEHFRGSADRVITPEPLDQPPAFDT